MKKTTRLTTSQLVCYKRVRDDDSGGVFDDDVIFYSPVSFSSVLLLQQPHYDHKFNVVVFVI